MAQREPGRVERWWGGGGDFSNSLWEVRELEVNYRCDGTAAWSFIDKKERHRCDWSRDKTSQRGQTVNLGTARYCVTNRLFQKGNSYNFSDLPFMVVCINLNLYYKLALKYSLVPRNTIIIV